jgi:hypothetical protein
VITSDIVPTQHRGKKTCAARAAQVKLHHNKDQNLLLPLITLIGSRIAAVSIRSYLTLSSITPPVPACNPNVAPACVTS